MHDSLLGACVNWKLHIDLFYVHLKTEHKNGSLLNFSDTGLMLFIPTLSTYISNIPLCLRAGKVKNLDGRKVENGTFVRFLLWSHCGSVFMFCVSDSQCN